MAKRRKKRGSKAAAAPRPRPPDPRRARKPREAPRKKEPAKTKTTALLARELDEARQQQAATADVLKVISRSTFDLQAVFDTLVESAAKLCEADIGYLRHRDGDTYRLAATYGLSRKERDVYDRYSTKPDRGSSFGRAIIDGRTAHIPDVLADRGFDRHEAQKVIGFRAALAVPLRRENDTIGVLTVQRKRAEPFSPDQIALIETFAAQAVIAIENTRLLNELRQRTDDLSEALEQQTATSEVLQVISSSPGELEPVFQAMLANATRICGAKIGILFRYADGAYTAIAKLGVSPAYAEYLDRGPIRAGPATGLGRVASTRQTIHIADTRAEQAYTDREPLRVATAQLGGARSLLNVPMLKEGELIGAIGIYRQEVRPFTDKQIELITNFASQAVIAIENTRLLNELRARTDDLTKSLEQQTATSRSAAVISSSPGELEPVFNAMLANAVRICGAKFGSMFRFDDDTFYPVASLDSPPALDEFLRQRGRRNPDPGANLDQMCEVDGGDPHDR